MRSPDPKGKNLDVYLMTAILLVIVTLGGAVWLVFKGFDARLDEIALRLTGQTGQIRAELFYLRKEVDQLNHKLDRLAKEGGKPASAPGHAKVKDKGSR